MWSRYLNVTLRQTDRQTDGRTDGRTDNITISIPRYAHSASRGKNVMLLHFSFSVWFRAEWPETDRIFKPGAWISLLHFSPQLACDNRASNVQTENNQLSCVADKPNNKISSVTVCWCRKQCRVSHTLNEHVRTLTTIVQQPSTSMSANSNCATMFATSCTQQFHSS